MILVGVKDFLAAVCHRIHRGGACKINMIRFFDIEGELVFLRKDVLSREWRGGFVHLKSSNYKAVSFPRSEARCLLVLWSLEDG